MKAQNIYIHTRFNPPTNLIIQFLVWNFIIIIIHSFYQKLLYDSNVPILYQILLNVLLLNIGANISS